MYIYNITPLVYPRVTVMSLSTRLWNAPLLIRIGWLQEFVHSRMYMGTVVTVDVAYSSDIRRKSTSISLRYPSAQSGTKKGVVWCWMIITRPNVGQY